MQRTYPQVSHINILSTAYEFLMSNESFKNENSPSQKVAKRFLQSSLQNVPDFAARYMIGKIMKTQGGSFEEFSKLMQPFSTTSHPLNRKAVMVPHSHESVFCFSFLNESIFLTKVVV